MKLLIVCILLVHFHSFSAPVPDSLATSSQKVSDQTDTSTVNTLHNEIPVENQTQTAPDTDSTSANQDTGITPTPNDTGSSTLKLTIPEDSSYTQPATYFGVGVGFTLGNYPFFNIWQNDLPSNLDDLGLTGKSYTVGIDTSSESPILPIDTATLYFKTVDPPNLYNMTYPVQLSITRFNGSNRFITSASFSMINKQLKAKVFSKEDSLQNKIDLIQKLALYAVSLDFTYGRKIPTQYFSVEKINRTDFAIGFAITPLLSIKSSGIIKNHSNNQRLADIADTLSSLLQNHSYFGLSGTLKAGISSVRKLSPTAALSVDIFYTFNVYNYFHENGSRILTSDFDKSSDDRSPFSFISNRFDIRFSLLRTRSRGGIDENAK